MTILEVLLLSAPAGGWWVAWHSSTAFTGLQIQCTFQRRGTVPGSQLPLPEATTEVAVLPTTQSAVDTQSTVPLFSMLARANALEGTEEIQ